MKRETIGIVAEFNPLHNGHKRLVDVAREENPDATIVVAMSGQFVQRGELSIFDKWTRAESAIDNGVDLVVEIPPFFVLNNANIFASKAMDIFNKLNVDKIYFGSETLSIEEISEMASATFNNQDKLDSLTKEHHSLPKAFQEFIGREIKPNDTLGICYVLESMKSGYNFEFHRVVRESNEQWSSASSIRKDIWQGVKNDKSLTSSDEVRNIDDYSEFIIGKLLTTNSNNNVVSYLQNWIERNGFSTFTWIISEAHNKSFTKAKLRREALKFVLELEGTDRLMILAMNNNGKDLLREVEEYDFRHTKENVDNYKVERFISMKTNYLIEEELAKMTKIK